MPVSLCENILKAVSPDSGYPMRKLGNRSRQKGRVVYHLQEKWLPGLLQGICGLPHFLMDIEPQDCSCWTFRQFYQTQAFIAPGHIALQAPSRHQNPDSCF